MNPVHVFAAVAFCLALLFIARSYWWNQADARHEDKSAEIIRRRYQTSTTQKVWS